MHINSFQNLNTGVKLCLYHQLSIQYNKQINYLNSQFQYLARLCRELAPRSRIECRHSKAALAVDDRNGNRSKPLHKPNSSLRISPLRPNEFRRALRCDNRPETFARAGDREFRERCKKGTSAIFIHWILSCEQ